MAPGVQLPLQAGDALRHQHAGPGVEGLVGAAGVSMASLTNNPTYDAFGSISIGVVLITVSIFVATRVRSLLVGRSADPMIQEAIEEIIGQEPDIEKVFNTITMQFGPDTMLAAKIKMRSGLDIDAAIDSINALERRLKDEIPNLQWCFIEPDVVD
jgi:divalent metal cation (Fe/Co/Zn/Cd) transporter